MTRPIVAAFGSSATPPDHSDYDDGVRCGRMLAEAGFDVVTGGYDGLMAAVSRGAADAGAGVVGVTTPTMFPARDGVNRWVGTEIPSPTITERIHELLAMSAAAIALPGSLGTLTELLVAWNLAYIDRLRGVTPEPVVTVGEGWRTVVTGLADAVRTDGELVTCVATVDEAVAFVASVVG